MKSDPSLIGNLRIRRARAEEAALLSALAMASKAYWGYSAEFLEACRDELSVTVEQIQNPRLTICVAETPDRPVGFYCLEQLDDAEQELNALFVAPDHIGRGVGRHLMYHAREAAAGMGARTILIQSDPNAEPFYLSAGAQRVGRLESRSIPGRMLPLFRIRLDGDDEDTTG